MDINEIPWLTAIGALLLVPLLFAFDANRILPLLTDALFLMILGLEVSQKVMERSGTGEEWLHAGYMGMVWGIYQLMALDMGLGLDLAPFRPIMSVAVVGLAIQYFALQYFGQTPVVRLPHLGMFDTLSTPLLILATFMFITLIGNDATLVTGAIFLAAAGHLINDENAYARYLAPLGALLAGYAVII